MIPAVVAKDLLWAGAVTALYMRAPTPKMRKVTRGVLVYVLIEVLLHEPMEDFAASLLRLLF